MTIKYTCFISYATPKVATAAEALKQFITQLKQSLDIWFGIELEEGYQYIDEYLLPGDRLDVALGEAICQSACMIVVFTGIYSKHIYCLRELLAMDQIEKTRKEKLGKGFDRRRGMIIPIILRLSGTEQQRIEDRIPARIKERYEEFKNSDFSRFYPANTSHELYNDLIKKIAYQIASKYSTIKKLEDEGQLHEPCDSSVLPSEDEAKKYWDERPTESPSPFF
jgi:hypothetical protein